MNRPATFTFLPSTPIGRRTVPAFVNGPHYCGPDLVERPEYSSEDRAYGKALRERRERVGIYLGAAARALGISVVELSSAERGGGRIQPDDLIELAWSRAKEPDGE